MKYFKLVASVIQVFYALVDFVLFYQLLRGILNLQLQLNCHFLLSILMISVLHVLEILSFKRLYNIPLYAYSTFYLPNHPSMDTWAASTFRLLQIMLL